jgi:acetyl esterase/lipase
LLAGCGGESSKPQSAGPALGSLASSGAGHRFYEIYEPSGPVRGTMLTIHGGGWRSPGGDARRTLAPTALTLRTEGWRVVNIDYTPGTGNPLAMMRDVVAFYDQAQRAFGGPICAYGESAGGHLAAMLAVERPALTCAVLAAAPTDLPELLRSSIPDLQRAISSTFGSNPQTLEQWSPAHLWNAGSGPAVFATAAENDTTVPPRQLEALEAADPEADTQVLPGAAPGSAGAVAWMHSTVRNDALTARFASLNRWLEEIVPSNEGEPVSGNDPGRGCSAPGDRIRIPGQRRQSRAGNKYRDPGHPSRRV